MTEIDHLTGFKMARLLLSFEMGHFEVCDYHAISTDGEISTGPFLRYEIGHFETGRFYFFHRFRSRDSHKIQNGPFQK